MLAVEADGAEVHAGAASLRRDLRRQNLLVAAGWTLLRFTWADLGTIAATVAAHLGRIGRGVA
jgi:very-short-patch-repair endonuclease